jgi:putative heme-binding domain-containing protein
LTFPVLLRGFADKSSARVGRALTAALNAAPAADRIPRTDLDRVLKSYPVEVRRSAEPLYRRLAAGAEAQRARLAALAEVLDGGDAQHGREIFFGRKAACASCHRIDSQGATVGPDLSKIGAIRTPRDLLEAVVVPSASFARGYRPYAVATDQGKILTGIVSRETSDAIHLKTSDLAEIRIPKEAIVEFAESGVSIMPNGLDRTLSRDELRDVIAFLRERK